MMAKEGRGYRIELPDPEKLSAELVRAAMPRATELVKDRAVKEAPVGPTGNLRRGIEARVEKGGLQGVVASTARHTFLVHEGAKAHGIKIVKKRALKLQSGLLRASAQHPGTKGQPFLVKALEESKADLERMFRQDGEEILKKALP